MSFDWLLCALNACFYELFNQIFVIEKTHSIQSSLGLFQEEP